jgi:hypothetical protein
VDNSGVAFLQGVYNAIGTRQDQSEIYQPITAGLGRESARLLQEESERERDHMSGMARSSYHDRRGDLV